MKEITLLEFYKHKNDIFEWLYLFITNHIGVKYALPHFSWHLCVTCSIYALYGFDLLWKFAAFEQFSLDYTTSIFNSCLWLLVVSWCRGEDLNHFIVVVFFFPQVQENKGWEWLANIIKATLIMRVESRTDHFQHVGSSRLNRSPKGIVLVNDLSLNCRVFWANVWTHTDTHI